VEGGGEGGEDIRFGEKGKKGEGRAGIEEEQGRREQ